MFLNTSTSLASSRLLHLSRCLQEAQCVFLPYAEQITLQEFTRFIIDAYGAETRLEDLIQAICAKYLENQITVRRQRTADQG